MALTRIRYALGRTCNLGNFESLRIDVEEAQDVPGDMDMNKAHRLLFESVKLELEKRIDELVPKPSKPARGKIVNDRVTSYE